VTNFSHDGGEPPMLNDFERPVPPTLKSVTPVRSGLKIFIFVSVFGLMSVMGLVWFALDQGELIIVEKKNELIKKMGQKKLIVELQQEVKQLPDSLKRYNLTVEDDMMSLNYTYDLKSKQTGITNLLQDIKDSGLKLKDLKTEQSNLEKIFVTLVKENNEN